MRMFVVPAPRRAAPASTLADAYDTFVGLSRGQACERNIEVAFDVTFTFDETHFVAEPDLICVAAGG